MQELIDRNALHNKIQKWRDEVYSERNEGYADELSETKGTIEALDCVLVEIESFKTIEPEVRHGRWKSWTTSKFTGRYFDYDEPIYQDYVYYTCSECYRKSAIQELYCPQCGARMDGGADNG